MMLFASIQGVRECYFLLIVQSGRNTSALSGYVIINDNGLHGFNGLSKMLINSVDKIR